MLVSHFLLDLQEACQRTVVGLATDDLSGTSQSVGSSIDFAQSALISKSEKMSTQRADVASTVHMRVSTRGCPIWATGRHPHAILAIPNHM